MADISFGFEDTDDCAFIDWDCVWRDWTWRVFKTISKIMALKYRTHPSALQYEASAVETKYQSVALTEKYVVHAIGKKTSVVEKL